MDNETRLQYLEAMGIDVWVPKKDAVVEMPFEVDSTDIGHDVVLDSWSDLQQKVVVCQKCNLCQSRKQTVFGEGDINADWMLIGEAPGHNSEQEGRPLVGQTGLLLTEMLRAIGLQRDEVYLTNIVKCRTVDDKEPKVAEMKACHDYLQRQIQLVKPKIIVVLGRVAAQKLLDTHQPLSELRGVAHQFMGIPLVVVYHPAYLLRKLIEKRKAWQDLQCAINIYQEEK